MTERKFTPPTEFPAEYITRDGRKAVIVAEMNRKYDPYLVVITDNDGTEFVIGHEKNGSYSNKDTENKYDLFDKPKTQIHWTNDYAHNPRAYWYSNREEADQWAVANRISVIRREWTEGQPPQYFTEEV